MFGGCAKEEGQGVADERTPREGGRVGRGGRVRGEGGRVNEEGGEEKERLKWSIRFKVYKLVFVNMSEKQTECVEEEEEEEVDLLPATSLLFHSFPRDPNSTKSLFPHLCTPLHKPSFLLPLKLHSVSPLLFIPILLLLSPISISSISFLSFP